jgi:hypothetical protein
MAYRSTAAKATAEGGGPSVLTIGSGKYLDAGAPGFQRLLVRIDVETSRVTALAQGEFLDLEVSSSGRFVAAYKYGAEIQPQAQDTILGGTVFAPTRPDGLRSQQRSRASGLRRLRSFVLPDGLGAALGSPAGLCAPARPDAGRRGVGPGDARW